MRVFIHIKTKMTRTRLERTNIKILDKFQVSTINFNLTITKKKKIENRETVIVVHFSVFPTFYPNY